MNNCEYSFEKFTHIEDLVYMLFTLLADSENTQSEEISPKKYKWVKNWKW